MKKTTWLVIISLVIALVLFISGVILGGVDELVSVYHQGELNISLPFIRTKDIEKEFIDIEDLDIEASVGNFVINEYNGDKIKVVAKNVSYRTELYQDNDRLIFKENFRFGFFPINNNTKVEIYVPENYQFDKVKINIDAASFKVPNLFAEELEIDVDAGSFKADKITADKIFIDVDAGDAKIGLLDSKKSEFDADVGDIKVTMAGSESDYSYEADCDLGDIEIGSYRGDGISNEYQYRGGNRSIKADCNVGSVIIKMEV
ncbi:MAG: DUF4097 family beta strand repeat-containing protein [Thomasclavelia sp.]|uniref:DUF4097 family beta strand repeat-containing protein n=1 Tax=Thomasclavelia sp. TaxID=3025757 RepID=UPI0039A150DB